MPTESIAATDSSQAASDPYVIYQLRKPSQRGTAVIPRFVPNTHAPAFSPANYRFARVWTANESGATSPSAQVHVPRSFEYAGSLGSESSIWSDTSSWVSISSLKTTPSEVRASLLHGGTRQVSTVSFFNEFENTRPRPSVRSPTTRTLSARSSELDSPIRDFQYPPALSESISEDAVVDDLMSLPRPEFPHLRNNSNTHNIPRSIKPTPEKPHVKQNSVVRSSQVRAVPHRSPLLPALTRKRRSLWQWLFCAENVAASTTATSMTHTASAVRDKLRHVEKGKVPSHASRSHKNVHETKGKSKINTKGNSKPTSNGNSKDRVPNADKDFFHRSHHAPDAHTNSKPRHRRSPSFEILKGRPSRDGQTRRSTSWNLLPAFLGRGNKDEESKGSRRQSHQKERSRAFNPETEAGRKSSRISFQKSTSQRAIGRNRDLPRDKQKERSNESNVKAYRGKQQARQQSDRRQADRQREDRSRKVNQSVTKETNSRASVRVSGAPPQWEKQSGTNVTQTSRMRSGESTDPVTSQISSDLSSGMLNRIGTSGSKSSTPVHSSEKLEAVSTPNYEPVSSGVSSDASSRVSGTHARRSPLTSQYQTSQYEEVSRPQVIDDGKYNSGTSKNLPNGTLSSFPDTSILVHETRNNKVKDIASSWEALNSSLDKVPRKDVKYGNNTTMDPIKRAYEKNKARSAGGPLSYLMKQAEAEADVNTGSTGLTSLADESVSTHKTMSAAGDEYARGYHQGMSRSNRESATIVSRLSDIADKSVTERKPIFQNSALFSRPGRDSPSHASSGASPRRFHSDWSDPHATDIDVYCQCSCNCVYEEECLRNCDMVYGRSPSVSSSRSCGKREGYQGFKTLPPALSNVPIIRRGSNDPEVKRKREINVRTVQKRNGSDSNSKTTTENGKSSFIRASALDQLADLPSSKQGASRITNNRPGQVGKYTLRSDYSMHNAVDTTGMEDIHQMGVLPESTSMLSQIGVSNKREGLTSSMQIESEWAGDGVGPRGSLPTYTPESTSIPKNKNIVVNNKERQRPRQSGDRPRRRVEDSRPRSRQSGSSSSRPGTADSRRSDGSRRLERSRMEGSVGSTNTSNSTLERRQRRPTSKNGTSNVVRRSGPPPYRAELVEGEDGNYGERRNATPPDEYEAAYDSFSSDKLIMQVRRDTSERRKANSQSTPRQRSNDRGYQSSNERKSGSRKPENMNGNNRRTTDEGRRDDSRPSSRQSSRASNRSRTPLFGMF